MTRQRAERHLIRGAPLIHWRPGCSYCLRMHLALGRMGRKAIWVDVSRDRQASARVRGANGGNPPPSWVRDLLVA
jgi:mycoredoxin